MARFAVFVKFTPAGIANIRDTTKRAATFRAVAKKAGVKIEEQLWTTGSYDGLMILECPNEAKLSGLTLQLASLGFVSTETVRVFDAAEMDQILGHMPK